MSLREYILRRQAHTRGHMETLRLETLPLLNAWTEDSITLADFFGSAPAGMSEDDRQALKALRYDVEQSDAFDVDDWGPVDEQLSANVATDPK